MSHSIIYDYEKWLVSLVDSPNGYLSRYSCMLDVLFDTPFKVVHPLDDNRIKDAIALRERFDPVIMSEMDGAPANFLEVFVALSCRYSDEVLTDAGDNPISDVIFNDILHETGLINYPNEHFWEEKVVEVLDKISYTGVVFCVFGAEKMDLWMQIGKFFIGKIG